MNEETTAGLYMVTFVGQYFNRSTCVIDAEDQEQAIRFANNQMIIEYGWDVQAVADEITAILEGTYE
jgi:hypothetical protein